MRRWRVIGYRRPRTRLFGGQRTGDRIRTTREFGGTLGVAVVGSVFLSVYGSKVIDRYRDAGLPSQFASTVSESMGGGLQVAAQLPTAQGADLAGIVQGAFIDGLSPGSLVAAGVVAAGALVALRLLPAAPTAARPSTPAPERFAEAVGVPPRVWAAASSLPV